MSQHERADRLPLVTESATVTAVEPLDHNRTNDVVEAVVDLLATHGADPHEMVEGHEVTWDRARQELPAGRAGELATLRERYDRPFPSLVRVQIAPDEPVEFVPGQYMGVRYRGTPRAYSLAQSPNADDLEICVRRVPGGRLSSRLCTTLEPGEDLTVRGPGGDFVLQEPSTRDMVFLATGTGVAPLRSMIEYTFEEGRDRYDGTDRDVWLLLGGAWRDDLPYRERFAALDDTHDNFHFVPTLSRESVLTDWSGPTAYVQYILARYLTQGAANDTTLPGRFKAAADRAPSGNIGARIDPTNVEVYACGISVMVRALVAAARALGVPDAYIRSEGYG